MFPSVPIYMCTNGCSTPAMKRKKIANMGTLWKACEQALPTWPYSGLTGSFHKLHHVDNFVNSLFAYSPPVFLTSLQKSHPESNSRTARASC